MRFCLLSLLIGCLLGFPALLSATSDYRYSPEISEDPNEITFEKIETEILSNKTIHSIEDFLKWLNEKQSSLLENYTLMHTSSSLQGSSYENPRAILFGKTGRLTITFNGEFSQKGFHSVELMQFRAKSSLLRSTSHFEFREINFPKNANEKIEISEANPSKCMRCHTTALKPIWDPYEIWEGAYGKRDDAIIDFDNDKYAPLGKENDLIKEHRNELQKFKNYQEKSKSHPRYQYLKVKEGSAVAPYSPNIRGKEGFRPNLQLTGLLTRLQVEQMVDQMLATDEKQKLSRYFLAESLGCDNDKEAKPKFKENRKLLASKLLEIAPDYKNPEWSRFGNDSSFQAISASLFLLGFEPTTVNLEKNPIYWQYFEGAWTLEELLRIKVYQELAKLKTVELPSFDWKSKYNYTVKYVGNYQDPKTEYEKFETACENLIPELKEIYVKKTNAVGVPPVVKMCLSCHESGVEAPKLNFQDRIKKTEILRRIDLSKTDSQSMPPTRTLGYWERREIIDYLTSVENPQE